MGNFGVLDLDVVRQLDEKSSKFFFSIITSSLDDMVGVIEGSKELEHSLSIEQVEEIKSFYMNVLDLFLEKEMYEECVKVKKVLEYLEKNYENS